MTVHERLLSSWRSGPPAPDLGLLLSDALHDDSEALLRLVRADVLERLRVRDLPAWANEDLPITLEHYESAIGHSVDPGTPLADLLVRAELEAAAGEGEAQLGGAIERLDRRFPDQVVAMLAALESGDDHSQLSDSLLPAAEPTLPGAVNLPERIGNYRLVDVHHPLGRGGMGVVYRAEQLTHDGQVLREVALKIIRLGVASPEMLRRFEHEAAMLAKLQHPGIATIHEAGTFDLGEGVQPFFAMELVDGMPLTDYAEAKQLSTHERLALIASICEAVQHAHLKGIIHRDLKPANILVTRDGHPKVLDFGVARATDADIQTTSLRTDIGKLIGTVPYMSPEQVSGNPEDLDTRSDVYALGVVAYELLAGRLPYDVQQKLVHEAVRVIQEDDPTPLSSSNRTLRGDVEIIVGKALEKEKERRYQSALDFASDIERYLHNEPIVARPPSAAYQFRKFARRHRALVGGVAAVFIVLVAGLIGMSILYARAEEARTAEAEQRRLAEDREQEAIAAREEAEAAKAAEAERADQLELVADFQASQLSGIRTELMGDSIRRNVIEKRRVALEASGLDEHEIQRMVGELDSAMSGVNFTNVALEMLDENIFERALIAIDQQFDDQPLIKARLLQTVATTMRDLGLLERAMEPQSQALKIRRRWLGDEHPNTLQSINDMGFLLWSQGNLSDAEPYILEALMGYRLVLGDEHPHTLTSINNMGSLLMRQGRLPEAERFFNEAMAGRRRILGDEDPDTLNSMHNMAGLLREQGKFAEAEPLQQEVVINARRILGEEHPHTLIAINDMGALLVQQGQLTEAEPYYRDAMEVRRRVFGENHPDTLISISNMGFLLQAQGKLAEAEQYIREALQGQRRVLGDDHPATLQSINNIGGLLVQQGKFTDAERYYRISLKTRYRVLGEDHPATLQSINNMGGLLAQQSKFADAEPYFREALEGYRRNLGNEHPNTLTLIHNMGMILWKQDGHAEAEPYLREAMGSRRRALGDEHPDTLNSINELGELLREQGKLAEAEALGAKAVAGAKRALPAGHWDTAVFLGQHARSLAAMERFEEAEEAHLEAQPILEAVLGPQDERTIRNIRHLADLYDTWHEHDPDAGYNANAAEWRARLSEIETAAELDESTENGGSDEDETVTSRPVSP